MINKRKIAALAFVLISGTVTSRPESVHYTQAQINKFYAEQKEAQKSVTELRTTEQFYREHGCLDAELPETTVWFARAKGIPAKIVAATVTAESSCKSSVVSARGAIGLMQVNPKAHPEYPREELLDPNRNLDAGTTILANYIHRYGLREGLHHYNGMGNPTNQYADQILNLTRR